jgi:pimeloyl-ACP methyl ester carboxylesterase
VSATQRESLASAPHSPTFGLVHGGSHGNWQWGALLAELDARGQRARGVDLPITDPALGVLDYAALVAETFADVDDLVLVGHSLGGYVLPFVTELMAVPTMVFLAGAIQPGAFSGLPPAEQMLLIPPHAMTPDDSGLIRLPAGVIERHFYHDVSTSLRAWAASLLRPQSGRAAIPERLPVIGGSPKLASIVCTEDQAISPEWSRAAARDALGVEPVELPGSHSPFLSRPAALADALVAIAS